MLIGLPSTTSSGLAVGGTPSGLAITRLAATTKAIVTAAANLPRIALPPGEIPADHTSVTPTAANASRDTEADRRVVPKPRARLRASRPGSPRVVQLNAIE